MLRPRLIEKKFNSEKQNTINKFSMIIKISRYR